MRLYPDIAAVGIAVRCDPLDRARKARSLALKLVFVAKLLQVNVGCGNTKV